MLLQYLRAHRLAVISSVAADGAPQAALVGIAITEALEIVFDAVTTSRKHANLLVDPRAAVTFTGPGEQTLQYEGRAHPVSVHDETDLTRATVTRTTSHGPTAASVAPGRASRIGESRPVGFAIAITTAHRSSWSACWTDEHAESGP